MTTLSYEELELCDIIMKGGITSGVVYPEGVRVLSDKYRLKSIGGTSAGAIAAALAAAAEYGRRPGNDGTSFAGFSRLPGWIGARNSTGLSNLASLFRPQRSTAKVFDTLFAAVADPKLTTAMQRVRRVVGKAALSYLPATILGALAPAFVAVLACVALVIAWRTSTALLLIPAIVLAIVLAVVGAILGCLVALVRDTLAALPGNYFGLCTGGGGSDGPRSASALDRDPPEPLTYWLADYMDELAGMPDGRPLTFGDLWDGEDEPSSGTPPSSHAVRLAMITTDLTAGAPRRLPFEPRTLPSGEREELLVREQDLTAFFPRRIVEHLTPPSRRHELWTSPQTQEPLYALPPAAELPVILATRLSLSFPALLSAFPIYVRGENETASLHWFSDGGITSNFPAHFFDTPLPSWPTFGINLHSWPEDTVRRDEEKCENVWMWPRVEGWDPPIESVGAFVGAIKDTMQNWRDNMQAAAPGYRERIAHIGFYHGEGGLNLYMPEDEIGHLTHRGGCAGAALRDGFFPRAGGSTRRWLEHRWTRYRSAMWVLEKWLRLLRVADTFAWPHNEPPYRALVDEQGLTPPFEALQAEFAREATDALLDLAAQWGPDLPRSFSGADEPAPELRTVPRM
jgi:hypothetical protein